MAIAVSLLLLVVAAAAPIAFQDQAKQDPAKKSVTLVDPTALEPFVPTTVDGWTKIRATSNRVADSCAWVYADVVFMNGENKLKVTVADTGFDVDALAILATIVTSFPAGHTETIPPDTVISRITYRDSPAATMWNATKRGAEFTVVVGDRFVVSVEGSAVDGLDTVRAVLDKIDLKKLADLGR